MLSMLASLLVELAQKQNWANSNKFGGILHIVVPLAEGAVLHAAVGTTASGEVVTAVSQHADAASALASVEKAAVNGIAGVLGVASHAVQ